MIEVKARGAYGDVAVLERQRLTFAAAGIDAWLYLAFNVTQPRPAELWLLQKPDRLPWEEDRPAERQLGRARGVRHEGMWRLSLDVIRGEGEHVDLSALALPEWAKGARD